MPRRWRGIFYSCIFNMLFKIKFLNCCIYIPNLQIDKYISHMKKFCIVLLVTIFSGLIQYSKAQLTPQEAAVQMQKGINLGNTLEPPLEGGWNNPAAQEYYFDMYKDAGFTCVRVPVRWDQHTQASYPYKIDE